MKAKPFVLQLVHSADGEKISHFKTIKHRDTEVKIFFTNSKIIFATFLAREFIQIESRIRGTRESLLGFEGFITEAIRINAGAPLLPRLHA